MTPGQHIIAAAILVALFALWVLLASHPGQPALTGT
jgi:hypothetical protein